MAAVPHILTLTNELQPSCTCRQFMASLSKGIHAKPCAHMAANLESMDETPLDVLGTASRVDPMNKWTATRPGDDLSFPARMVTTYMRVRNMDKVHYRACELLAIETPGAATFAIMAGDGAAAPNRADWQAFQNGRYDFDAMTTGFWPYGAPNQTRRELFKLFAAGWLLSQCDVPCSKCGVTVNSIVGSQDQSHDVLRVQLVMNMRDQDNRCDACEERHRLSQP